MSELANFDPRLRPITFELGFGPEESIAHVGKQNPEKYLRSLNPAIHSTLHGQSLDGSVRAWALELQRRIGMSDERLDAFFVHKAQPESSDEQEVLDLHTYGGGLTTLRETIAGQIALSASPLEKVVITPEVEGLVSRSHNRLSRLLAYYNSQGMLVPDPISMINDRTLEGKAAEVRESVRSDDPKEIQEEAWALVRSYFKARDEMLSFDKTEQGQADLSRRLIVLSFMKLFAPGDQLLRAWHAFGTSNPWEIYIS